MESKTLRTIALSCIALICCWVICGLTVVFALFSVVRDRDQDTNADIPMDLTIPPGEDRSNPDDSDQPNNNPPDANAPRNSINTTDWFIYTFSANPSEETAALRYSPDFGSWQVTARAERNSYTHSLVTSKSSLTINRNTSAIVVGFGGFGGEIPVSEGFLTCRDISVTDNATGELTIYDQDSDGGGFAYARVNYERITTLDGEQLFLFAYPYEDELNRPFTTYIICDESGSTQTRYGSISFEVGDEDKSNPEANPKQNFMEILSTLDESVQIDSAGGS